MAPRKNMTVAAEAEDSDEGSHSADTAFRERELTRILMASVGDAVITTDALGRVASLNPVAEAMTGWRLAQGKSFNDLREFDA